MWPFKRKAKQEPNVVSTEQRYVTARVSGVVTAVQTGLVEVDGVIYGGLRATLVQPGQEVKKGQPLGKK